jgi:hypothetical protein
MHCVVTFEKCSDVGVHESLVQESLQDSRSVLYIFEPSHNLHLTLLKNEEYSTNETQALIPPILLFLALECFQANTRGHWDLAGCMHILAP